MYRLCRVAVLGVTLVLACQTPGRAAKPATFAEDIAPIVYEKCTRCHRQGQAGPFPLISYEDVSKRAETIEAVVNDGYMPPWPPSAGHIPFANDRRLTDEQKSLLMSWIKTGTPEGDRSKTPAPPAYPDGWSLGEPDLVATMNGTFAVPADGPDLYRSFVVPIDLPEGKWVKAIELRPQARSLVHHALYFAVDSESAREKDARTPEAGFAGMASPIRERLGGYVPGVLPERLPEDLAQPLPAHTDLVIQTHFHPNGKEAVEQMTVGLYFTDQAPSRELSGVQLPPLFGRGAGIDIPAGEDHFVIQDSYTLPADATAYLVSGHAHYVCQQQELVATFPDGTKQTLLDIDDWDLNWQGQYRFGKPVKLPAGTRLDATLVYDNSSANPQNPHSPPQRIRWGEQSTDEMGSITVSMVADHPEDASKLKRGYFQKLVSSTGVGRGGILQDEIQKRLGGLTVETFGRLDANRDGVLQKTEIPERSREGAFRWFDVDEDGTIDKTEWESRLPKSQDEDQPAARPGLERLKSALQGRGGRKEDSE